MRGGQCHCRYSDRPSCVNSLALGARVRTTKLKINLVRSLMEIFSVARGRFGKAGRIRTFTQTEVFARADGKEKPVALHAATLMPIEGRGDICNERSPGCGRIALLMLAAASPDTLALVDHGLDKALDFWTRQCVRVSIFAGGPDITKAHGARGAFQFAARHRPADLAQPITPRL